MTMEVSSDLIAALRNEAAKAHPEECCGIIFGNVDEIRLAVPAKNTHQSPQTHFEIDPVVLISAHKAERSGGLRIIGYYHSHPKGSPDPSSTDQAMAARDGKIWAIIGCSEDQSKDTHAIKFWRDAASGFELLSYVVAAD